VRIWALIGAGGMIGGLARYGIDQAMNFTPWATLIVNVLGCLAIGFMFAFVAERSSVPFWIAGVLGGFTTFSAFAVEAVLLLLGGRVGWALAYIGTTLILGLLAVPLGQRMALRT
jgi:CrcB protein